MRRIARPADGLAVRPAALAFLLVEDGLLLQALAELLGTTRDVGLQAVVLGKRGHGSLEIRDGLAVVTLELARTPEPIEALALARRLPERAAERLDDLDAIRVAGHRLLELERGSGVVAFLGIHRREVGERVPVARRAREHAVQPRACLGEVAAAKGRAAELA